MLLRLKGLECEIGGIQPLSSQYQNVHQSCTVAEILQKLYNYFSLGSGVVISSYLISRATEQINGRLESILRRLNDGSRPLHVHAQRIKPEISGSSRAIFRALSPQTVAVSACSVHFQTQ
jgi:hypothetical protein